MKKTKKSWKIWIVIAFIAVFLITCGAIVYAVSGFVGLHKRTSNDQALTSEEWNQIMQQIDGLGMYGD